MALTKKFYEEIFEKEVYWTDLAQTNLLNIYYLNGKNGIKDFYIKKRNDLTFEYESNKNVVLKFFIDMIDQILLKIESLTKNYENNINIDIVELTNLFLINQMSNNFVKKTSKSI